jgi:adenylate/nucleoside-diphosphate kinase
LDGYPRTIDEALALSKVGIIPTVVYICDKDDEYVLKKVNPKFGGIDHVIHQRLKSN